MINAHATISNGTITLIMGLDWLGLHDLHHACASSLLAFGASLRTVMKTLGHSQIGLAMNSYTHVLTDIGRAAVDVVAKKLFV